MMIRKAFAALLLFAAPAAAADGPSRIFEARDLFSLEAASDPQISPDGSKIAYVRRSGDIMTDRMRPTIWLIDTRTGEQAPLAAGPGAHSQPRWSPDGKRLAYISTAEGGAAQLFVRWMASGESVRITGLPDAPSSIAWSPDGRQIAYTMFVPGDGLKLGSLPPQARGRAMGAAARDPQRHHLPHRRGRLSEARLQPHLPGRRRRRSAAPAELRLGPRQRSAELDSGRPRSPVQQQPLAQLGARGLQHRSLCARRGEWDDRRSDQPQRARQRARRLARRPADRLYRL
jgi:dipeptidyl aminopeptidase/acylaminoacyl peptidase